MKLQHMLQPQLQCQNQCHQGPCSKYKLLSSTPALLKQRMCSGIHQWELEKPSKWLLSIVESRKLFELAQASTPSHLGNRGRRVASSRPVEATEWNCVPKQKIKNKLGMWLSDGILASYVQDPRLDSQYHTSILPEDSLCVSWSLGPVDTIGNLSGGIVASPCSLLHGEPHG